MPRALRLSILPLLALLLTAASPLLPGVGDGARVVVDAHAPPWTSLARVQVPGGARCTGVVVAPRAVLTAAHCLFLPRTGHLAAAGSVHVLTGYAGGGFAFHATAGAYRILPGWKPGRTPDFAHDAALLTLDATLPAPALPLTEATTGPAMLGGYNQDRAEVIEADTACALQGAVAGGALLRHDCAATRGTSGAPVLIHGPDGWAIAGLQVGAATGRGGVAVPAASLHELLDGG